MEIVGIRKCAKIQFIHKLKIIISRNLKIGKKNEKKNKMNKLDIFENKAKI